MLRVAFVLSAGAALCAAHAQSPGEVARLAAMQGRKSDTLAAVEQLTQSLPVARLLATGGTGWELTPQYSALVRFGLWDELIALLPPDRRAPGLVAGYLYGRGVALAARGRLAEARATLAELEVLRGDARLHDLVAVAAAVVAARIAASELHHEEAAARLREAVATEDRLPQAGSVAWFFPVRHLLGAELVSAGQTAEAEHVYREDLERNPDNGWSLFGLAQSLDRQDRHQEAMEAEARFAKMWSKADIQIHSSCLCQPGVALAAAGPQ